MYPGRGLAPHPVVSGMPEPRPDFAFRLPADVAAQIRATAPGVDPPRRVRLAPRVWRFDDRGVD
jgi:hypothetical protein